MLEIANGSLYSNSKKNSFNEYNYVAKTFFYPKQFFRYPKKGPCNAV